VLLISISMAVFLSGCVYNPDIDPANFVSIIDNPYYPLIPGTTFFYQNATGFDFERNEVYVTNETKTILGVVTTIVLDRVWNETGDLVEETYDWYAQDKDGNVWYFGEDTKEYKNGVVVSTKGYWEAGKNGSKPGIIMKADLEIGDSWWEKYALGIAIDRAKVLSLNESATVPYGSFENCLKTQDWTPLEPRFYENKYFYPGVGEILEVVVKGGSGRIELINITYNPV
jgi:hypothetical protein